MKKSAIKLLTTGILFFFSTAVYSQTLDKNLESLSPLIEKKWEGKLWAPDGSKAFDVTREFTPIWNGKVIKMTKTNLELNNSGEGYIYWDDMEKKIAFFFIESKGVFLKGFINTESNMIIFEGILTWPEGKPPLKQSYDFKNTFEFTSDDKMKDKWSHNAFGEWRTGHTIEFENNK